LKGLKIEALFGDLFGALVFFENSRKPSHIPLGVVHPLQRIPTGAVDGPFCFTLGLWDFPVYVSWA